MSITCRHAISITYEKKLIPNGGSEVGMLESGQSAGRIYKGVYIRS